MGKKLIIPEKIIRWVKGRALPKPEDNQNTDDMVYGGALNRITFKGYGKELFAKERYQKGVAIPDHPLNNPKYSGANILIGGENFGCGSSREHAPQAFLDYGFKALISAGYAGIFQANCASIGLVAVTLPKHNIESLVEFIKEDPKTELIIDLKSYELTYIGKTTGGMLFKLPDNIRESFFNGIWDALALLRQNKKQVKAAMDKIPYFKFK